MGLGRLDNSKVVMVDHVLPGELVLAEETRRHRGYVEARAVDIIRASADRCPPACPLSGQCGGCHLQHAVYSAQLAIKEGIVLEMAQRAGLVPDQGISPIAVSPQTLHYRYKLRLHVARDGRIGFHRAKSNTVVPLTSCLLASRPINEVIARCAAMRLEGAVSDIELFCSPADQGVSAVLGLRNRHDHPAPVLLDQIMDQTVLAGLALRRGRNIEPVGDWFPLRQAFFSGTRKYTLSWDCRSFFQVNPSQNERLVQLVLELAGEVSGRRILDLYCGMGNFAIPVALAGAEVHGVEVNPHAIRAAEANARQVGLADRVRFSTSSVQQYLHAAGKARPDLVLIDPPRQGLARLANAVACLGAERIIYISCDPATLFRDLRTMTGQGYTLASLQPVDMFPQTSHIETVALLEKN